MPNISLPLEEQEKIAAYIEEQARPLEVAAARTQREIKLMQEYRTRLTADIVTGKLDVREAAARLPNSPGPDEISFETDCASRESHPR